MAIDPVFSVSFEAIRGISLADATRDGRILEAKVTAMLSDTLARLSIAGQDIDVTTPQRLPVGAQLTLRAERDGGQLRLITQAPIRPPAGAPAMAAGAQQTPDILIELGKSPMAQVQAIAVEALFGDGGPEAAGLSQTAVRAQPAALAQEALPASTRPPPNEAAAPTRPPPDMPGRAAIDAGRTPNLDALLASTSADEPASPQIPLRLPLQRGDAGLLPNLLFDTLKGGAAGVERLASMLAVEALLGENPTAPVQTPVASQPAPRDADAPRIHGQPPPETQGKAPPDAATLASMIAAEADKAPSDIRRDATMEAVRAYVSADTLPGQTQASRQAAFHIEIPLYFQGNPQPLRLQVTRDEEEEAGEAGAARPRSWTIRFAAEAGVLGMIHAAISMADGRVGVQLWAEEGDTAASFRQDAAQLQDALEAASLTLDALKIQQGAPPAEGSGR